MFVAGVWKLEGAPIHISRQLGVKADEQFASLSSYKIASNQCTCTQ